jgi:hypothetical protein
LIDPRQGFWRALGAPQIKQRSPELVFSRRLTCLRGETVHTNWLLTEYKKDCRSLSAKKILNKILPRGQCDQSEKTIIYTAYIRRHTLCIVFVNYSGQAFFGRMFFGKCSVQFSETKRRLKRMFELHL